MRKPVALAIASLLLISTATISAASPGTIADPLISLSYLEGAFEESLLDFASQAVDTALGISLGRLDAIYKKYIGYSFAPRFIQLSFSEGDFIELTTGSSFILLEGSAALSSINAEGTVVNISSGAEAAQGTELALYQRYFCAENTTAQITVATASVGQVDGYYLTDGKTPKAPLPFIDIPEGIWYYAAVEFVYGEGLYSGTSANTFSPDVSMTRGMFVTVLHRLDGLSATGEGGMFSDVRDPSQYYYDAVTWANASGIVTGYEDGTFRPNDSITREQMAVTMHRYATYKGRNMYSDSGLFDAFPDKDEVSQYAVDALRWAATWNVINGSDGKILPQNTATRAQVAQIVLNYCEKIGR